MKTSNEVDAENNRCGPFNPEIKLLSRKHASNTEIDKDESQDNPSESSEINEPRQPSTPFGVVNETLNDTQGWSKCVFFTKKTFKTF